MQPCSGKETILTMKVHILPGFKSAFASWQAKLHKTITTFPGFVSLEIVAVPGADQSAWAINQRFYNANLAEAWCISSDRRALIDELRELIVGKSIDAIQESVVGADILQGGVTEVFITQVARGKEGCFREWIAKMHQVEAGFPGFRGVYVQSPGLDYGTSSETGKNWITLLQFDTQADLDYWLASAERQQVLTESKSLISAIESHRVISSYAGWFSSLSASFAKGIENGDGLPPVWKQTMLVLLVLFPIVMLEFKFLSPWTAGLNPSLATFIGNSISVVLISWPMMPISIWFLGWWLSPSAKTCSKTIAGICAIAALYVLEIALFWNFLPDG